METTQALTRTKWSLDPSHSKIGFKVKHLMVTNVRGVFNEYDGSIYTTGEDFAGTEIDLSIYPASMPRHSPICIMNFWKFLSRMMPGQPGVLSNLSAAIKK